MPTDTVILRNQSWNTTTVEARQGNLAGAENNPPVAGSPKVMHLNEDWVIYSDGEDVYYRRDADPDHPTGTMTDWTLRACYGNGETFIEDVGLM
jgi:hypothetical protein